MLLQILANTPKWVFALFAALLWLGLSQLLTRRVGLSRITGLAIGMSAADAVACVCDGGLLTFAAAFLFIWRRS